MPARKAIASRFPSVRFALAFAVVSLALPSIGEAARRVVDPECTEMLEIDRAKLLAAFAQFQNPKTYTPAKARAMQAKVEAFLLELGTQLKNFNVERFVEDGLDSLRIIDRLPEFDRAQLVEILRPSFASRRAPTIQFLRTHLQEAGLGHLPTTRIHAIVDRSFRVWRTKLVFDDMGGTTYNRLAKAFSEKLKIGEFSMEVGLLGKNGWEAFLEGEKGPAIFNPSMRGLLEDRFMPIEAHESVHMIVQTLASLGRPSPYHAWIKINPRFKKFGAIGRRQRDWLYSFRDDPLGAGDFYRAGDLFVDEIPAHIVEAAYLDVSISRILRREFTEYLEEGVRSPALREEAEVLYADILRQGLRNVVRKEHSEAAWRVLDAFLVRKPSELGRTGIGKMTRELADYMNWIDVINDNVQTAIASARKVIVGEQRLAAVQGRKTIALAPGGPIRIHEDTFLGKKGYFIEVKIPIDVLESDGSWRREPRGAWVRFRFTGMGDPTKTISAGKIEKLFHQLDWTLELNREVGRHLDLYARMLKDGRLRSPTVRDILALKREQTEMRGIVRKVMGEIRGED